MTNTNNIRVEIIGGVINIFLHDDFYLSPRFEKWLLRFESYLLEEGKIIINDPSFNNEDGIYSFKNSIKNQLPKAEISYDDNFKNLISRKIENDNKFSEFTNEARKIWNDDYETNDLKSFTSILSKLMPRRLYDLQLRAAYHMVFSQNSCNFSVPGAGKTSIVYAAYAFLKNLEENNPKKINKLFIVGPPSSFSPWEKEYFECFNKKPKSIRLSGELSVREKINSLVGIYKDEIEIYLITYQSISNYSNEIKRFFEQNKVMFVCDEAHKFKRFEGEWASAILELSKFASSRITLTGTPAPNGYQDLYNIFKFIYPENNILDFNYKSLCDLSESKNDNEIERLIDCIKPFFVRIKKQDLNLPPFNNHTVYSKLDKKEQAIYDNLKNTFNNQIEDSKKVSIFFRKIQAVNNLHLLTKAINPDDKRYLGYEEDIAPLESVLSQDNIDLLNDLDSNYFPSKFYKILDIISDLKKRKEKVIFWGVFIDSIKRLNNFLQKKGFKGDYIIGETKKSTKSLDDDFDNEIDHETREYKIEQFLNSDSDYLISNPVVLGESVSLHKQCNNAIYFELSYAAAPYIQSRDRIHRVWLVDGKQKKYDTDYYHIISEALPDKAIFDSVNNKFEAMLKIIEQDIPFFPQDLSSTRQQIIDKIIHEYSKE